MDVGWIYLVQDVDKWWAVVHFRFIRDVVEFQDQLSNDYFVINR
jgi:hypothetical protein